ncbi:MAG: hypothetical protein JF616_09050 [Fibrobacteres bacterium]|jgi:hypothetical protein|nr:hypothetical protein [Fibrobacterota bacterium]
MGLKRNLALGPGMLLAFLTFACGTRNDSETLSDRLQGNWTYTRIYPDQGFTRRDNATLAVHRTTIQYSVYVSWECDTTVAPCPGKPPDPLGGYFEGDFTDLGDSLVLRDGVDTVSFHSVTDTAFTFIVNGTAFPMRRN